MKHVEKLRLFKGGLTDRIYAGKIGKQGIVVGNKVDLSNDFLSCVIQRWEGQEEVISCSDGKVYKITVTKLPDEPKKNPR